jgi:ribosomal protein S18 acetylase RimI-like enzyme
MVNTKSLRLIPSNPKEVNLAVELIYSSGPTAFEYVFQNNRVKARDFLKYAFMNKGGEFSYENHHSLYLDEEMIGIGGVFDAKAASRFTFWDGYKILRYYRLQSLDVIRHGLGIEKIIKLPKSNEIALAHLGIKQDYRGKGLGTQLISELMKIPKKRGQKFVLDVSEENPRAHALYEKLGFKVTSKSESNLRSNYSYVANHFRMELVL